MSEETVEEFMRATYRALCAQGYANLTMQDIADESSKSKAALHYHFDGKQDLLARFQTYVGDRFLERVRSADTAEAPEERLDQILDAALSPPEPDDHLEDIQTALLELKAQAPYEPAIREQGLEFDETFRDLLEEVFAAGVEAGTFRADLDPEAAARFVATMLGGSQVRTVFVGEPRERTRELLETYVEEAVLASPEDAESAPVEGRPE